MSKDTHNVIPDWLNVLTEAASDTITTGCLPPIVKNEAWFNEGWILKLYPAPTEVNGEWTCSEDASVDVNAILALFDEIPDVGWDDRDALVFDGEYDGHEVTLIVKRIPDDDVEPATRWVAEKGYYETIRPDDRVTDPSLN